eukprot:21744-Hanusia_phi.AAC.2
MARFFMLSRSGSRPFLLNREIAPPLSSKALQPPQHSFPAWAGIRSRGSTRARTLRKRISRCLLP